MYANLNVYFPWDRVVYTQILLCVSTDDIGRRSYCLVRIVNRFVKFGQ